MEMTHIMCVCVLSVCMCPHNARYWILSFPLLFNSVNWELLFFHRKLRNVLLLDKLQCKAITEHNLGDQMVTYPDQNIAIFRLSVMWIVGKAHPVIFSLFCVAWMNALVWKHISALSVLFFWTDKFVFNVDFVVLKMLLLIG